MEPAAKPLSFFAIIIGIYLIIQGFWGLVDPPAFGIFTTNITHATIHILLGIAGIYTGLKGGAYGFSLFLGILLLLVGIFYFIPGISEILVDLFNLSDVVAYLNITIGTVSLFMALIFRHSKRTVEN